MPELKVTNKLMSPEAALTKYGFYEDPDTHIWGKERMGTQAQNSERWLKVEGGWLGFRSPYRASFGEIPFGWPVASLVIGQVPEIILEVDDEGDPVFGEAPSAVVGFIQIPQGMADSFEGTSGLHPASHPMAFRWLWTDDEIAYIYQFAEEGWVKSQDANGVITMTKSP